MISLRNILKVRSLSLFRTNIILTNDVCKERFNQLSKSKFHQCASKYGSAKQLGDLKDDAEVQYRSSSKTSPLKQPFAKPTGRYQLAFTCKKCNTRNTASISKVSYHHGVVVASCQGCKAHHLIADNLKWFGDKKKNIEDILKEKGESVTKITTHDLYMEVLPPEAPDPIPKEEMGRLPPLSI